MNCKFFFNRPWLVCALTAFTFLMGLPGSAQAAETIYGKKLVATYELPVQIVAEMNNAITASGSTGNDRGPFEKAKGWGSEEFSAPTSDNPYTLVVKVTGTAKSNGDAMTRWNAGWGVEGSGLGSSLITGVGKTEAKAGERIEATGSSKPLSFKTERKIGAQLGLFSASNIQLETVKVEIWAGLGKSTGIQKLFAWSPLLLGLVFLGVFLWFRRG
jgi:hypothetical protein